MRLLLPVLLVSLPLLAEAGPASYFKWQSRLDGQITCRQASPGAGWVLFDGTPYRDLRCTRAERRQAQGDARQPRMPRFVQSVPRDH